MEFTGERLIPGVGGEIELEHRHRYLATAHLCQDLKVLDIACGTGYGAQILARAALRVHGVDSHEPSIDYARKFFPWPNLTYERGEMTKLPLEDGAVDVVSSFESIEHIGASDQLLFLEEVHRVLTPKGFLVLSTPLAENSSGDNPFHLKELTLKELTQLLQPRFLGGVEFFFQKIVYGSLIAGPCGGFTTFSSNKTYHGHHRPTYVIAIASKEKPPLLPISLLDGSAYYHQLKLQVEHGIK